MKIEDRNSEKKPFRLPFFWAMKKRGLVKDEPHETGLVQSFGKIESERMGARHIIAPKENKKAIKKSEIAQLKAETSKVRDKALSLYVKCKEAVDKRVERKDTARTVDDILLACRFTGAREVWNYLNLAIEELDALLATYDGKDEVKT